MTQITADQRREEKIHEIVSARQRRQRAIEQNADDADKRREEKNHQVISARQRSQRAIE